jgi:hypothetical protein
MWVGGYDHTLQLHQDIANGQKMSTLTPLGRDQTLTKAGDYRNFLNHIQQRKHLFAKSHGATDWMGDRIFEIDHSGPEAIRVTNDLKNVFSFPEERLLSAYETYSTTKSSRDFNKFNDMMTKYCPSSSSWKAYRPITILQNENASSDHSN